MKRFCCFLLFSISISLVCSQNLPDSVLRSLEVLDKAIEDLDLFTLQKQERIRLLQQTRSNITSSSNDLYWINNELYKEYCVFDSDSALVYAEANLDICRRNKDINGIALWKSRKVFVMIMNGMMLQAEDELKDVQSARLDTNTRIEYFEQQLHLCSHVLLYDADLNREYYRSRVPLYKDSIAQICMPGHPMYLWYKANRLELYPQDTESVTRELYEVMSKSSFDTRIDAMNAYALARIYRSQDNNDNYIYWLTKSAIADLYSVNREIASIQELSRQLYELGNYQRAYRYISLCRDISMAYNNRVRLYGIMQIEHNITESLLQQVEEQSEQRQHLIITLGLLLLGVLLLAALLYRSNHRLHSVQHRIRETNLKLQEQKIELSDSNDKLAELNEQFKDLNEQLSASVMQLNESNFVKEQYIGAVFQLCSSYINKMDDFRRNISRKLKTRLYDDARQMTESPSEVQNVVKEFYHSFDETFLNIYPDFVKEFNELLIPEERIELKEGELLNTELRIYALVRMGITESLRISQVLHCSPQTVYNNRNKTRNKAIRNRDNFDEMVRNLGK